MSSQLLCQNFRRANDPAGYAGYDYQPRPQGFSHPFFKGKALGTRLYDYYKLLKYSGARLMLCLVYLVIMWVAVWNESDRHLFSE